MKNLRTHGKSTIVWVLMGLMILGLGGFGVTSFSGGSTAIGSVGGTKITAEDYARALRNQMNAYQQQTGQALSIAQAQAIGLPQAVQAQLITAAALEDQANRIGVAVGDEKVRQTILEAPAFKGPTGSFDRAAYADVLRRENLSEAEFEREVRMDEARLLIQRAVAGGVAAPKPAVETTTKWILERRDIAWHELTEDMLPAQVAEPDEATLKAWHSANADRFTAPETRKITYVWLTPEMLAPSVQLDEAALRAAYDANLDEYQRPERRMVSRLVFPSAEEAEAAKAQIDAGTAPFETFVIQRGLQPEDAELGEVAQADLGAAGEAVFGLAQPGVVGPIQTDLGPALFAVHAILEPVNTPFEQAREDLRAEAALDRAGRTIEERSAEYEDLLAGGASLEQVAEETELEIGTIDWSADAPPAEGSIAGYQAFRDRAAEVSEADFPELANLDDGGVFALRLDEVVPPTLRPFEEVRDEVEADWRRSETHRQLLALAEEQRLSDAAPEGQPAPEWTAAKDITRDGWIEGAPAETVTRAFAMKEVGDVEIVDAENRVILMRLDAIHEADLTAEDALRITDAVRDRIGQSLQSDIFDYYARAVQREAGIELDQSAINAINAQVQ
ncbi:peptidylprolyl isomerase [Paracoccus benzoatiresistens]|uniref:SurA N-terminal domain-containing protein n=1 Tax=Paracoccus benzoatiresistens TaxID=2997341 RepID=A0ABT4J3R5_9RHOB|nr:peptidylprolyl isomerase [Paracoccus sp. EF6]MCZ0961257.1 SurA N-terminal domain-containing protein [Paracoccus sp. EF6]